MPAEDYQHLRCARTTRTRGPEGASARQRARATRQGAGGLGHLLAQQILAAGEPRRAAGDTPLRARRGRIGAGGEVTDGMGADAGVYLFDCQRYRHEVVPALAGLLRGGAVEPWLRHLLQPSGAGWDDWTTPAGAVSASPPDRSCPLLHLPRRGPTLPGPRGIERLARRGVPASRPARCPERSRCPLHQARDRSVAEAMNSLFEAAVAVRCLGPSQFAGRSMHPPSWPLAWTGCSCPATSRSSPPWPATVSGRPRDDHPTRTTASVS